MRKYYLKILLRLLPVLVMLLGLPVAVWLVNNSQNLYTRAVGESADIVVFLDKKLPTSDNWVNLAQGGEERGDQLDSVVDEVTQLSPQYIRLDHIYDFFDVVKRDGAGSIYYTWDSLDKAVDTITRTGAKPFFSLSYMPEALSSGTEVDVPRVWSEWESLVKATIEHYSGKTNKNLTDVYYEVWNEPDLFGSFKLYGEKNYLELYKRSANAASRAVNVNEFKIGGPATTALYPNWFTSFIEDINASNIRIDFYSWHRYSQNIQDFGDDAANIGLWLSQMTAKNPIELIITESGFSSENDVAYDTRLGAIHTLALVTEVEDSVNKIFHFEIKDGVGPEQFWGRWGLLTHNRHGTPVKKERYKALEFLNRMRRGQHIQVEGQGSWVRAMAREIDGVVKILIVNYDPNNKHFETVPITLHNVPEEFTWKRTNFLGKTTERFAEKEGAVWKTQELFEPNTAAIFEILE